MVVVFTQMFYIAGLKDGNCMLAPISVVEILHVFEVQKSPNHNTFLYFQNNRFYLHKEKSSNIQEIITFLQEWQIF